MSGGRGHSAEAASHRDPGLVARSLEEHAPRIVRIREGKELPLTLDLAELDIMCGSCSLNKRQRPSFQSRAVCASVFGDVATRRS